MLPVLVFTKVESFQAMPEVKMASPPNMMPTRDPGFRHVSNV